MSIISPQVLEKVKKRLACGLDPKNVSLGEATNKTILAAYMAYCASKHGVDIHDDDLLAVTCRMVDYAQTPAIVEKLRSTLAWMRRTVPEIKPNTTIQPKSPTFIKYMEESYAKKVIEEIRKQAATENAQMFEQMARDAKKRSHQMEKNRKVSPRITDEERHFFYAVELRMINDCPITSLSGDPLWEKFNLALELIELRKIHGGTKGRLIARAICQERYGHDNDAQFESSLVALADKIEAHFFDKQMPVSCLDDHDKANISDMVGEYLNMQQAANGKTVRMTRKKEKRTQVLKPDKKATDNLSKDMRRYTRRIQADKAASQKTGDELNEKVHRKYIARHGHDIERMPVEEYRSILAEIHAETMQQKMSEREDAKNKALAQKQQLPLYVVHKVRLSPNNVQQTYLKKCFGVARFCYNWAYDRWIEARQRGERPFASELRQQFLDIAKEQYPFVYDVTANAKGTGFKAFAAAQDALFDGKGFPQRKKKGIGLGSLHYNIESDRKRPFISDVNLDHPDAVPSKKRQYLLVPGLGYVKMMEKLRFQGLPTSAVVKLESDGHYYAAIRVRINQQEWNLTHKDNGFVLTDPIGIDLGVATAATFSNGVKAIAPKTPAIDTNRQKQIKKQVEKDRAAKRRNTKNKRRRAWQLAKSKAKQNRRHDDFLQKLSSVIAKNFFNVSVEDLNIISMIRGGDTGAGGILKASFYKFRLMLEHKMSYAHHNLHIADKGLPSTRTCSQCGCIGPKVPLKERTFHCAECGAVIDRDLNAAINLARLIGMGEPEFKSVATDALLAALETNGIETSQVTAESR